MQYVLLVHCENILLKRKGRFWQRSRVVDFSAVTTRVVTASTPEEAGRLAVESALAELQTNDLMNTPSDPPRCMAGEVLRMVGDGDAVDAPRRGFTFYSEPKQKH
jgi:hypothetical protein